MKIINFYTVQIDDGKSPSTDDIRDISILLNVFSVHTLKNE